MSQFNIIDTGLKNCFEIQPKIFEDNRGAFVKLFHQDTFEELGLISQFQEEYYSVSEKGVLRGLHFQTPPDDHVKVVTCVTGSILDVVVDIRKSSNTYGKVYSTELNDQKRNMMYVPKGFAHGFYVLSNKAVFISLNSTQFSPNCDAGIKWDSIDFKWPDYNPELSEKDKNLPGIIEYQSPF